MARLPSPYGYGNRAGFSPFDLDVPGSAAVTRFFNQVYAWMCVGLAVTAAVAYTVAQSPQLVVNFSRAWLLLVILEVVLVMVITSAINRISTGVATALFVAFAAMNGLTLSVIFLVYTHALIASAFVISAGTFGAMSVFGLVTKRDLSGIGRIAMMALIGIIIASVVSIFWHNSMLQVVINYVGVLVFVALTAFDTQRLLGVARATEGDARLASRMSIVGSLILYLDFINLFIFILQILGNNSRRD